MIKKTVKRATFLALAALVCSAHVGSPDVWYEGNAGPYPVLVVVKLPGVIPGVAEVTVHVTGAVDRVTLFVNRFDARTAAPPPDNATRASGDSSTFLGRLWVMAGGSNSVTVGVYGPKGSGTAVVPVVAVSTRRLPLYRWLGVILGAIGIFLFVGAVSIGGAAVREATLDPGQVPDAAHRRRARLAMAGTGVLVAVMLFGGWTWWNNTDAEFRRLMYRPLEVQASVASPGQLRFAITDSDWTLRHDTVLLNPTQRPQWSAMIPDHGKLMHLFLVEDSGNGFAHLHPLTADTDQFHTALPPLPPGRYHVFADIVHASGFDQTLVTTVEMPSVAGNWAPSDSDDAWSTSASARTDTVKVGQSAGLKYVSSALQPYMGMAGHAVVVRDDDSVFIHLHPMGTISTASQQAVGGSPMQMSTFGDTVSFPYAFPKPGRYRVWVQVKRGGRILTVPFTVVARQ
jgi:hypothetical protein